MLLKIIHWKQLTAKSTGMINFHVLASSHYWCYDGVETGQTI